MMDSTEMKYVSALKTTIEVQTDTIKQLREALDVQKAYVAHYKLEEEKRASKKEDELMALNVTKKKVIKKVAKKAPKKVLAKAIAPFMQKLQPSVELGKIIGSEPLCRTDAVKKIWLYIKKNKCQNPKNPREIMIDDKMRPVFKKEKITMFEMAALIGPHLTKEE
jgi:upstream activation factor subunit UAF30